jgi:hypothetical protein
VFEVFAEFGLRPLIEPFRRPPNPWLAAVGYAIFGALAGAFSLWAFPTLFIAAKTIQLANLALTPLLAGIAMNALGAWRLRRKQSLIRLDRFTYGYLFALAMALVRFVFGA